MGFMEAVTSVIVKRYVDFQGRSCRSEYWWFLLFNLLLNIVINIIATIQPEIGMVLSIVVMLGLLLPGIAVTIRRLHDLDKSGWWILILLIPIVNIIMILVWFTRKGTEGDNQFGPDQLGNVAERFS